MLLAGASAVGVGTATFRDPRAPLRIARRARDWCARHGVARVARPHRSTARRRTDDATDADVRDHLALALDVGDLDAALALARARAAVVRRRQGRARALRRGRPRPPSTRLHDSGFRVFADLKLHDIPTTVERAARVLGRHGVDFLNFHAAGGVAMLRAGVEGLARGRARRRARRPPVALAVTVLTSDPNVDAFDARLRRRARRGMRRRRVLGARSVDVRAAASDCARWCPASGSPAATTHDQARVDTPGDAIARGADWLVVGRAVTGGRRSRKPRPQPTSHDGRRRARRRSL